MSSINTNWIEVLFVSCMRWLSPCLDHRCPSKRDKGTPGLHPKQNLQAKKDRREAGCLDWWRRRESNPRPQVLCLRFYMFSRVNYL